MTPEQIRDAADLETGTHPERPAVPVGVTLTPGTTKALERYETAYDEWVKTDAALVDKLEAYRIATTDDAQRLDAAARKGEETRPEPTAPTILPDLEYAMKVSQARRRDVDEAVRQVAAELDADADLDRRIFDVVEAALDEYEADVEAVRQLWNAANNKVSPLLANLAFVQPRVRQLYAFDLRLAHHSVPSVTWPEPRTIRHGSVRDLITELRKLLNKTNPEPVYPIRRKKPAAE